MSARRPLILLNGRIKELPANDSVLLSYEAATTISGHTAVVFDASGKLTVASPAISAHQAVVGITTASSLQGALAAIVSEGILEHAGWTFTPGTAVLLGANGALVQTPPPGAVFSKVLGVALSPTLISLDFQSAIFTS